MTGIARTFVGSEIGEAELELRVSSLRIDLHFAVLDRVLDGSPGLHQRRGDLVDLLGELELG